MARPSYKVLYESTLEELNTLKAKISNTNNQSYNEYEVQVSIVANLEREINNLKKDNQILLDKIKKTKDFSSNKNQNRLQGLMYREGVFVDKHGNKYKDIQGFLNEKS